MWLSALFGYGIRALASALSIAPLSLPEMLPSRTHQFVRCATPLTKSP